MANFLRFFVFFLVTLLLNVTDVKAAIAGIFVFGDSLVDNGNNNNRAVPLNDRSNFPYYGIDFPGKISTGRFSNGFNSADYIAKLLGFSMAPPSYLSIKNANQMLRGVAFASAGSGIQDKTGPGTINMKTQVGNFRKVTKALSTNLGQYDAKFFVSRSIFIITTANNDLFEYYLATGATNSTSNHQFISNLVDRFTQHITDLYNLGARNFYIAGTGQLGCVPFMTSKNPKSTCVDTLNRLSVRYNTVALDRVTKLSGKLHEMRFSYSDIYGMTYHIMDNLIQYGITEKAKACCGGGVMNGQKQCGTPNTTFCTDRSNYFYWDWFHPTQTVQRITSQLAFYDSPMYSSPMSIRTLAAGIQLN